MMSQLLYQAKQAWASLKTKPAFVITILVTMGLTIGALLCILTLAQLLLVKPLPYPEQEKLYSVEHSVFDETGTKKTSGFSYAGLIHLYKNSEVFSQSALINYEQDVLTSEPEQITMNTAYVTPEWFQLLGTSYELGRGFELTEGLDSNNPVAILSYQTWKNTFAQDPNILSKKVTFRGISFRVLGVVKRSFIEPRIHDIGLKTDIWLAWDFNPNIASKNSWAGFSTQLKFIGKIATKLSNKVVEQSITPLVNEPWQENVSRMAFFRGWYLNMQLNRFDKVILGDSKNTVGLLLLGVIGLLVIAVANIANLFISRTAEQQHQLAIHAAIGAKKSHLFKNLLTESGLLMFLSIIIALIVAQAGFSLFQHYLSATLPRVDELALNLFTFSAAVIIAAVFAVFFAYLSSNMTDYRTLNSQLQSSGKGTGSQVSKRMRQLLIVGQVAIAGALVFVNISLFKGAVDSINIQSGYELDHSLYVKLSATVQPLPSQDDTFEIMEQLRSRLLDIAGVIKVSRSESVLEDSRSMIITTEKQGQRLTPNFKYIDQNYFSLLKQSFLEGDNFSKADIMDENEVVIVNEVLAHALAPTGSALGQVIEFGGGNIATIIGVVKGVKMPGKDKVNMRFYAPSLLNETGLLVKSLPNQPISRNQIASLLSEISSSYTVFSLQSLNEIRQDRLFTQRTTAISTAALAALTLFLAGIGLYGILSYSTQMRRAELGTRLAIGAKRKDIVALIIADNVKPVIFGAGVSVLMLLVIYISFNESWVLRISTHVVPMFMTTLLLIAIISVSASYFPLRKIINRPAIYALKNDDS